MSMLQLSENQELFNKYRLVKRIDYDSIRKDYQVWEAIKIEAGGKPTNSTVAVKICLASHDESAKKRLRNEDAISTRLRMGGTPHNLLIACDPLEENQAMLLLPFPKAESSLNRQLRTKNTFLDLDAALILAADLAQALKSLHNANIYHLDVHPGNILWHQNHYHLADLGFAFDKESEVSVSLEKYKEMEKIIFGKSDYLPPEVLSGNSVHPTSQIDVYMFGAVLWQALTGKMYQNVTGQSPQSFRKYRSKVPLWLDQAVMSCLAEPQKRPADGEALVKIFSPRPRDGRLWQVFLGLAIAILIGSLAWLSLMINPPPSFPTATPFLLASPTLPRETAPATAAPTALFTVTATSNFTPSPSPTPSPSTTATATPTLTPTLTSSPLPSPTFTERPIPTNAPTKIRVPTKIPPTPIPPSPTVDKVTQPLK